MKYFSEITGALYDTQEALDKDEAKIKAAEKAKADAQAKKKAERASRAKEVDKALKAADEATEKARKLLDAFLEDYGSYHTSVHEDSGPDGYFKRTTSFGEELSDLFTDVLHQFLGE